MRDGILEGGILEGWDTRGMGYSRDGILEEWDTRGMGYFRDGILEELDSRGIGHPGDCKRKSSFYWVEEDILVSLLELGTEDCFS